MGGPLAFALAAHPIIAIVSAGHYSMSEHWRNRVIVRLIEASGPAVSEKEMP